MKIVISSGHGKYIRGASGFLDEVDEARRVVDRVAELLRGAHVEVVVFHDNTSTSQSQNLDTIVAAHNRETRDLDVSVHFNAYETTSEPMGTEVLYVTQSSLANELSAELAGTLGLPNRGGKYRSDLAFLNGTEEPAILIETCFVDSSTDADHYRQRFEGACLAIAETIGEVDIDEQPPERPPVERPPSQENRLALRGTIQGDLAIVINDTVVTGELSQRNRVTMDIRMRGDVTVVINGEEFHNRPVEEPEPLFEVEGACSWFGGPDDMGVDSDEGLAFIFEYEQAPHLFLPEQPPGTTGLARRLNPDVYYVACRWDYDVTPKDMLADKNLKALVRANDQEYLAWPADWGPHGDTDRVADLSPGLMEALGIITDDDVEVIYPAPQITV